MPDISPQPLQIPQSVAIRKPQGTWQAAKTWLDHAQKFEQCKLWSQVMCGFELIELNKQWKRQGARTDIADGPPQGPLTSSQPETKFDSFQDAVEKELSVSIATAYRFIDMAKAAAPKLRKISGLEDFDPSAIAISAMTAPKQELLAQAVHKITDGKTQLEFALDLGLCKALPGANVPGRDPGDGGRKKISLDEAAQIARDMADHSWKAISHKFLAYRDDFMFRTDDQITGEIAELERQIKARKMWLEQPRDKRDPEPVKDFLKK